MYFSDIELLELLSEMELTDMARGLTAKSIKKNRKMLTQFFKYLDSFHNVKGVAGVKTVHIKEFMVVKQQQGSAETYVNSFLRSIRALFSFAVDEGYIKETDNPVTKVKWMREQKTQVKAWSDKDVLKMIKYVDEQAHERKKLIKNNGGGLMSWFVAERNKLMILLLADTGLRVSELLNLQDKDITDRAVYVIRGKGKKDRSVYCSVLVTKQKLKYDRAKRIYFQYKEQSLAHDYVFVSKLGEQLTVDMVERFVYKIGRDAGCDSSIRMSPHTFRHYFTQKQLDLGANVYDLQILLGHSSIKTTETYLRSISSDAVLKRGLEKSPLMNLSKKRN